MVIIITQQNWFVHPPLMFIGFGEKQGQKESKVTITAYW